MITKIFTETKEFHDSIILMFYKGKYKLFLEFLMDHKLFLVSSVLSQIAILFYFTYYLKPSIILFIHKNHRDNAFKMIYVIVFYLLMSIGFNLLHKIYLARHCLKASLSPILYITLTQWRLIPGFLVVVGHLMCFPIILGSGIIMLLNLLLVKNQWSLLFYILFLLSLQCFFSKAVILCIGKDTFVSLSLLYPLLMVGNNIRKAYLSISHLVKDIK